MKQFIIEVDLIDETRCKGCPALDGIDQPNACYDFCRITNRKIKGWERPDWCPMTYLELRKFDDEILYAEVEK